MYEDKQHGSSIWVAAILNPMPGDWTIQVNTTDEVAFTLNLHTVPSADVVDTSLNALNPLYGSETRMARRSVDATSGFWWNLTAAAVVAVVGVVIVVAAAPELAAAAVAATTVRTGIAVVGMLAVFIAGEVVEAQRALDRADTNSRTKTVEQVAARGGYMVALDRLLICDQALSHPDWSDYAYKYRFDEFQGPKYTTYRDRTVELTRRDMNS